MAKTAPEWEELTFRKPQRPSVSLFPVHTILRHKCDGYWLGPAAGNLHFDVGGSLYQSKTRRSRTCVSVQSGAVGPADVWSSRCARQWRTLTNSRWRSRNSIRWTHDLLYVIAWPNQVIVTAGGSELHRLRWKSYEQERPAELAERSLHRPFGLSPNQPVRKSRKAKCGPGCRAPLTVPTWKLETPGERAGTVYAPAWQAPR